MNLVDALHRPLPVLSDKSHSSVNNTKNSPNESRSTKHKSHHQNLQGRIPYGSSQMTPYRSPGEFEESPNCLSSAKPKWGENDANPKTSVKHTLLLQENSSSFVVDIGASL